MTNLRSLFGLILLSFFFLTSCQKENLTPNNPQRSTITTTNVSSNSRTLQNARQAAVSRNNSDDENAMGDYDDMDFNDADFQEDDCFTYQYPVKYKLPNGEVVTYASAEEEEKGLIAWFEANEDSEEWPTLAYPITVTLKDGSTKEINNEEEEFALWEACYPDMGDDDFGDDDFDMGAECYTYVYPIQVKYSNGEVKTYNTEEEYIESCIDSTNVDTSATLIYPVTVTLEDGTTKVLNSEEEEFALLDQCIPDGDFDMGEGIEEDDCFTYVYPIKLKNADGTVVTYETEEAFQAAFENADIDAELPTLVYPVTVKLKDGSTKVINSEEEENALWEGCYPDMGDLGDMDDMDDDMSNGGN